MDIKRQLRLVDKISPLRTHVDCMEALAKLDREKHNGRKSLIKKGTVRIRHSVFGEGVWVKDTLVLYFVW